MNEKLRKLLKIKFKFLKCQNNKLIKKLTFFFEQFKVKKLALIILKV